MLGALALVVGEAERALALPTNQYIQHIPEGGSHEERSRLARRGHARGGGLVAGCGGDDDERWQQRRRSSSASSGGGDVGKVAVLLPDSKSSVRWETVDRPFLKKAFDDAGVEATIQNAEGDKATQQQQAEQAITNGAKVLLLVNLDSGSGAAIEAQRQGPGRQGHRLRPPHAQPATSDYYVSFDNEKVGQLQGQGLVDCLGDKTGRGGRRAQRLADRQQRDAVQEGLRLASSTRSSTSGDWKKVDDQSVPDWDNQKALTIFEQMLQKNNNKIDGVLAANDGLGNAAISALKQRKLPQVPVTGQDATLQGIQNIVNGDQCMTVYKAIKKEADAAAKLAIALAKGEEPAEAPTTRSTTSSKDVPSVLLDPVVGHEGQHQGLHRRAGLPEGGGDLRRQGRRQVQGARPAVAMHPGRPTGAPGPRRSRGGGALK